MRGRLVGEGRKPFEPEHFGLGLGYAGLERTNIQQAGLATITAQARLVDLEEFVDTEVLEGVRADSPSRQSDNFLIMSP